MLPLNKGFLFWTLPHSCIENWIFLQSWNEAWVWSWGPVLWVFSSVSQLGLHSSFNWHSQHCTCTCSSAISGCDHCSRFPTETPLNSGAGWNSSHILRDWKCGLQESNCAAKLWICACIKKWQSNYQSIIVSKLFNFTTCMQYFFCSNNAPSLLRSKGNKP